MTFTITLATIYSGLKVAGLVFAGILIGLILCLVLIGYFWDK